MMKQDDRVILNVSGELYETFERTLRRYPETLLGRAENRFSFYSTTRRQYFFNRNRKCFSAILYFYQSFGMLRCPDDVPIDVFEVECKFFRLPEDKVDLMKLKAGIMSELQKPGDEADTSQNIRARLWNILENPETSYAARIFTIVSLAAIILSILAAILETEKSLKVESKMLDENPWAMSELLLNTWFLFEFMCRFFSSPSRWKFALSILNFVDALAIFPYFIMLAVTPGNINSLRFLRILRLVRVLRLFKLSKHSKRLKIVGKIILSSMGDLQLLLLCLFIVVTLAGSIMYHMESPTSPTSKFYSIPNCMWWGIVTITTVGYGDIYPHTIGGKVLSGFIMAFGAVTMSLPVLAIVAKFELFYEKNVGQDEEAKPRDDGQYGSTDAVETLGKEMTANSQR